MQWNADPGAGFTRGDVSPWLPLGDVAAVNVADQRADPRSTLNLCRDLIALRRRTPDLRSAAYGSLPSPPGVWAWRRGDGIVVALNLSDEVAAIDAEPATILIATDRRRDGEEARGGLTLEPWQGVVLGATR